MSRNTVRLTRDNLESIQDIFNKFPETHSLAVTVDNGSGIGPSIVIALDTTINDYTGTFEIDITDVSSW